MDDRAPVGLTIDKEKAIERFAQALVLARAEGALPDEWLERTRKVSIAKNMTFTPVLGTALLAKATDDAVDALSLREDESHKGYSARSLAKEVLVPCCVRAGIDLRNKGAEPLNNQPFLRAARVSTSLKVKSNAVADLEYLCDTLQRADFLRDRGALEALAAFLRVRIAASGKPTSIELGPGVLDLPGLLNAVNSYVEGDSEGGKVGQALATAILELAFAKVRTKKINDPSSKWPGDVGAFDGETQIMSAEVKQRPFSPEEILLFAQRLREAELHRGFVVAFAQEGSPLDLDEIRFHARRLYQVELWVFTEAGDLLEEAIRYAPRDVRLSLARFPRDVLARMEELEVSPARMKEWAALFATPSTRPPP